MREDSAGVRNALSADVVADQPRLAGGRTNVLGLGANNLGGNELFALLGTAPTRRLGLLGSAAPRRRLGGRRLLSLGSLLSLGRRSGLGRLSLGRLCGCLVGLRL